ncbi:U4/U6.U5 small nuclear ribonucleoprotein 27 kDa protein-like protein [Drosera capensis]
MSSRNRDADRDRDRHRDKDRDRDRDRDTTRDRDRDRDSTRDRDRARDREVDRRRDKDDRDRTRRSPTPERTRSRHARSRTRSPDRHRHRSTTRRTPSRSPSRPRRDDKDRSKAAVSEKQKKNGKEEEGEKGGGAGDEVDADEVEMMKKLGIPTGFDSTKGKPVPGANVSGVRVVTKRQPRQYMNRRGGFNRPLPAEMMEVGLLVSCLKFALLSHTEQQNALLHACRCIPEDWWCYLCGCFRQYCRLEFCVQILQCRPGFLYIEFSYLLTVLLIECCKAAQQLFTALGMDECVKRDGEFDRRKAARYWKFEGEILNWKMKDLKIIRRRRLVSIWIFRSSSMLKFPL